MARAASKSGTASKAAAKPAAKPTSIRSKAKSKSSFDNDTLLQFYKDMLLIRRFEERAGQLYGMGLIGGFCHLYIGQESVAVGVAAVAVGSTFIRVFACGYTRIWRKWFIIKEIIFSSTVIIITFCHFLSFVMVFS